MPIPGKLVAALLASLLALPLAAQHTQPSPQPAPEPAQQLARDVIWNELHDPDRLSHWEYLSTRIADGQTLVREQVETREGPVSRVLARNGAPLTAAQQQREARRVRAYIQDPSAIARAQRDRRQDAARLVSIMQIIPQAFLFQYQGSPSGGVARLSFRPNPAFVPSGYDARIVHALTGTMTVDLRNKRLMDIRGVISQPVAIGFGLLGSVSPGGTFEIHRCQVSPHHWKTDLVDIHVQGKLLMLKSLARDQHETRSGFRRVPQNISLAQADQLLSQAAAHQALQAQLGATPGAPQDSADASLSSGP